MLVAVFLRARLRVTCVHSTLNLRVYLNFSCSLLIRLCVRVFFSRLLVLLFQHNAFSIVSD